MTRSGPVPAVEEQNAILSSVTTLLVHRLPGDWEQLFLDLCVMGRYLETECSGLTIFGSSFRWQLPDEALPLFLELREGMARPETGTWVSLAFRLTHPDTYSVEFNRDAEPAWLHPPEPRHYIEELELHPRSPASTPQWLSARAGVPPEVATLFAAPVFDDPGRPGESLSNRPAVHPQELDDVLAYLEEAPIAVAARGYGTDTVDPDARPAVPLTFHTDGTWVWPGGVAHYLRVHRIPPIPQLVQHIRGNGYRVPDVDAESLRTAGRVATGQVGSADVPPFRPRVISDADRRALDRLRRRLEHYGVRAERYGIVSPKPDALVLEPAPGPEGWQVQFWDADRGPRGRPTVYRHAEDAAKVLLAELLWRDDPGEVRAGGDSLPATAHTPVPGAPAADIQALPGEPPLSLLRDRTTILLPAGTEVDRFGGGSGNLVYAARTPFGHRSLPPDWAGRPYHVYRVVRPVPAVRGVAVPWFGEAGGGAGYFLARAIRDLVGDGSLVEVADAPAG